MKAKAQTACFAAISICAMSDARALEDVEYRLLGPAWVHHQDLTGAALTGPGSTLVFDWHGSSITHTESVIAQPEPAWASANPALGIEMSYKSSDGVRDRRFLNFAHDSYGAESLMGGWGRAWHVASWGSLKVEVGASGGLWWRTTSDGYEVGGKASICHINLPAGAGKKTICADFGNYYVSHFKRVTTPFVLPFVSITDKKSGLGANLAFAPRIKFGDFYTAPTNTLMLQLTYRM